jgi:hypothetical protein
VKIKGIHTVCGREFLVEQIIESHGHCPWDGEPFNNEYTALLAKALAEAERTGSLFAEALEEIADTGGDLALVQSSVLDDINASLARLQPRKRAGAR